jgi:hypothetical protein
MQSLKTNLVINDSEDPNDTDFVYKRLTDFRVFDRKSVIACEYAIRAGVFGRTSRARFWLIGVVWSPDREEWTPLKVRFLLKDRKQGVWKVNEYIWKMVTSADFDWLPFPYAFRTGHPAFSK